MRSRYERTISAANGKGIVLEIGIPSSMDDVEKHVIEATLDLTDGDKSRAARLLNIGRKTLYRKLELYDQLSEPPA